MARRCDCSLARAHFESTRRAVSCVLLLATHVRLQCCCCAARVFSERTAGASIDSDVVLVDPAIVNCSCRRLAGQGRDLY